MFYNLTRKPVYMVHELGNLCFPQVILANHVLVKLKTYSIKKMQLVLQLDLYVFLSLGRKYILYIKISRTIKKWLE